VEFLKRGNPFSRGSPTKTGEDSKDEEMMNK